MRSVSYKGDNSVHLSPAIWGDLPIDDWEGYGYTGAFMFDDFLNFPTVSNAAAAIQTGLYGNFGTSPSVLTQSAVAADGYGAAVITPKAASAGELYMGAGNGVGYQCTMPASTALGKQFAFECRVKSSTITATQLGFAVGLGDPALAITTGSLTNTATDIIATANFIGFRMKASGTGQVDAIFQAANQTQQTVITTLTTLTVNGYVKLGFRFDPQASTGKKIRFFLNGIEQTGATNYITAAQIAAATFPSAALLAMLALTKVGAGAAGALTMDWWAVGQAR